MRYCHQEESHGDRPSCRPNATSDEAVALRCMEAVDLGDSIEEGGASDGDVRFYIESTISQNVNQMRRKGMAKVCANSSIAAGHSLAIVGHRHDLELPNSCF